MSYDSIDYQRIRARTERRLSPMLKLHRRRTLFVVYIVLGCLFLLLNGLIYETLSKQFSPETVQNWYAAVMIGSMLWLTSVIIIAIGLALAFRREGFIQREMSREIDLERLRLLREPSQAEWNSEKPKRAVSLADDGELIASDELPDTPLRRNMNHREG